MIADRPTSSRPWVDLLVTTYRRAADVARLLDNLRAQRYAPFRLQVFDGSPDTETASVVEAFRARHGEPYPLVYHRTPSGMTRQRNIAVDHACGEIAIFLDDDVELEPDYLEVVVRVFEQDPHGTIAGLNGFDHNGSAILGVRQRLFRAIGLLPPVGCARYLPWGHGTPHYEGGVFTGVRDCDLLIGHNMAWRTSVLKELRFASFYEEYPTYVLYDDQDISLRARTRYRLVQCGDARLRHHLSPAARPPGFHYGFQTVFNAYRNFRVHRPTASRGDHLKFWVWEGLNMAALVIGGIRRPALFATVRGRLAGAAAALRGVTGYREWAARRERAAP